MAYEDNLNEVKEDAADIAPFDTTKKEEVVIQDHADDHDGLDNPFSGLKKKKKKKKKQAQSDLLDDKKENATDDLDDCFGEEEGRDGIILQQSLPWEETVRKYEEVLGRVFDILCEQYPELAVMRPPPDLRKEIKRTFFANFMDLCRTMHRQPEHVMKFLLAELGTVGLLDGQQRLVVVGNFTPKIFERILRRYINEYVSCNGCKSPDTILLEENHLFLRCEKCGSGRSVAPIKLVFCSVGSLELNSPYFLLFPRDRGVFVS